ncbi:MAG: hypothetical protein KJ559_03435, partial [Nanoarchaeota archaeon]|nr:hypothetical protein [Nanoarchaeota archaeon]
GGGGGGGGGSSSDEYYCGDGFCKTSEENETSCPQDCGVAEKLDVIKVENKAEKQDDKITNLNGKSPITGAVIGSNNSNLLIPVLFIGVLCLAGVIVFVFKRKP